MTIVQTPHDAAKVAKLRKFVDSRFRDYPDWDASQLRLTAHGAVDKLIAGDHVAANAQIQLLGGEGAQDMRVKIRQLGIPLEPAT